jgi:glycosyltransferase A (GT-A) superfamily protein (DUF2064 family)
MAELLGSRALAETTDALVVCRVSARSRSCCSGGLPKHLEPRIGASLVHHRPGDRPGRRLMQRLFCSNLIRTTTHTSNAQWLSTTRCHRRFHPTPF